MNQHHVSFLVSGLAVAYTFAATLLTATGAHAKNYRIERIASGLNQPTYVTQAPNDPANILYFTERTKDALPGFTAANTMGKVWRYDVNTRTKTVVLDLSSRSVTQDTGLQTIAFHPDFNTPASPDFGKMYVSSSEPAGTALNRVEEYTINLSGPTPSYTATFSRTILQYQNNAQLNHTVDWIGFDPTATGPARNDLYVSTGDGSFGNGYNGGNSPTGRPSQNPSDVAGKMLRVDVVGSDAYPADPLKNFAIPSTNPIPTYNAAHPGSPIPGVGEVYLTGLRNVYRASFDRANGDLWMGDVGETFAEEVDFLKAGSNAAGPPIDYGWPQREATFASNVGGAPHTSVNPFTNATSLEPIQQFLHDGGGEAIIGGYIYRGPVASLQGKYFYTDFVGTASGAQIWSLAFDRNTSSGAFNGQNGTKVDVSAAWQSLVYDPTDPSYLPDSTVASSAGLDHIVSFGEDNAGNVYLVDFGNGSGFDGQYPGAGRGEIFKIAPTLAITVTVDRSTGTMQLTNATGTSMDIRGYSIASAAGAIASGNLTPITNRLDAPPSGNGTIDPNNSWQIMSAGGSHTLFSEASTGGAANLSIGESFDLSPADGWIQSIYEDFDLHVTLGDGSLVDAILNFTGNGGEAFERSDLNFNGGLDPADWTVFRSHHLMSMVGLSKAESYGLGDLDGDGDSDFIDFRLFQADYTMANGAGAFAALAGTPEPSTFAIVVIFGATVILGRRHRHSPFHTFSLVSAMLACIASSTQAALVHQYTFNDGTAEDLIGTADGTLNGNVSISLGVANFPGGANDYISLPGPTIAINTLTDVSFAAWFQYDGGANWQRVFDFGDTNGSGQGRNYLFYSHKTGNGDNRAAVSNSNPGNLSENVANAGAMLPVGIPQFVAVVFDNASNGGSGMMSVYLNGTLSGSVALTKTLSGLRNNLAYLGNSLYVSDPTLDGRIDEFRMYDHALTAQQVTNDYLNGPVPVNLLRLEVNTVTGATTIRNQAATPLVFDYYRVASTAGALSTTGWNSLDDQNAGAIGPGEGESWSESGGSNANQLGELFLLGASNLASGASLSVGNLFNTSVFGSRHIGDLTFQFALQGGELRQSTITYINPPPVPGDYNDNGVVDAADYTVWRDHLGTSYALPNEVSGTTPGSVTTEDYDAWTTRFGNSGAGAGSSSAAVPEPTSAVLLFMGCSWLIRSTFMSAARMKRR